MTTVYKVVRRRKDGQLASVIIRQGKMLVIYAPEQPSSALNGMKLLAFDELRWAKDFQTRRRELGCTFNDELWEGVGTGVKPQPHVSCWWAGWKVVKEFWADGGIGTRFPAPPGTVACDSITLIKRVDNGATSG